MNDLSMRSITTCGALDGGPKWRMPILRNGNVPCYYFCNVHVDSEIALCHLSNLIHFKDRLLRIWVVKQYPH